MLSNKKTCTFIPTDIWNSLITFCDSKIKFNLLSTSNKTGFEGIMTSNDQETRSHFGYKIDENIAPTARKIKLGDKIVDWSAMAPSILLKGSTTTTTTPPTPRDVDKSLSQNTKPSVINFTSSFKSKSNHLNNNNNNNNNVKNKDQGSYLRSLAYQSLNLTVPVLSSVDLREVNWIQLSGHENTFAFGRPGILYKKCKLDGQEAIAYGLLMEDTMRPFVPKFHGTVELNDQCFIAIENLLYHFDEPNIMDIKMGSRTFLEEEVANSKPRADLYEKLVKLDPSALTEEEKAAKAITKLKYMQFREELSSSSTLGFRIEAFKTDQQTAAKDLSFVKSKEQVIEVLRKFLPNRRDQIKKIIERLYQLKKALECSKFFKEHEIVGSSLLIVYDKSKVGVWMIDFAKTIPLPEGIKVTHESTWVQGNHEDGYLLGLKNLISILEEFNRSH